MKTMKTFKTRLLTMALLLCNISANAYDFRVDGICYDFLASEGKVQVTYEGFSIYGVPYNRCTGDVTIPESVVYNDKTYSVTSIGNWAFSDCTGLTNITIPNSVTSIGNWAFNGCTGLTNITIPNSVTIINSEAFYGCTSLTSFTLPNSVRSIGKSAFHKCSGLTSINVNSGNTVYDSRDNCNAIIETRTNTLILGCQSTNIPNSVTSIGESSFSNCTGLTDITIPNSVKSIGVEAFSNCN